MNEADRSDTPSTDLAYPRKRLIARLWPRAAVVFGMALTGLWICLLGYGLAELFF